MGIEPARFRIATLETNHYTEDKNLINNYRRPVIYYFLLFDGCRSNSHFVNNVSLARPRARHTHHKSTLAYFTFASLTRLTHGFEMLNWTFFFMISNDVDCRILMFCSKDTDTGNAVSETQTSKECRRGMPLVLPYKRLVTKM